MYRYDEYDHQLVHERVEQFRRQVKRRLNGELTEEQFKPLRLMNGLYLQLHAYMLRIAIPYGCLSSVQMRKLAYIARRYDRGYGHFTTRQNFQLHWAKLEETPDILAELAEVEMHAIQTSGNSFRNVTSDEYAGAAAGELEDPRISCEIIRQWSTLHPEFSFLPRKFKFAVTATPNDRTALRIHDIALRIHRDEKGETGFEVMVGGGLGRTPFLAKTIRRFLPKQHLLSYIEAILRIYNQLGRRDNSFKARIKILVNQIGIEKFTELVEEEWRQIRDGALQLSTEEIGRIAACFAPPKYEELDAHVPEFEARCAESSAFRIWAQTNVAPHKQPGYSIVNLSLKPAGGTPGDLSAEQMAAVADLAERYSFEEIRVSHRQNLVLPHVKRADLYPLWEKLSALELATPNIGLVSDTICCPGLDYCGLATARSIPIAQQISERFVDLDRMHQIGEVQIKISGCINACGHHHVGHIGILGLEKAGEEFYQVTLGGAADEDAALGAVVGRGFSAGEVVDAVETILETYVTLREEGERFIETLRRIGLDPFKERLYDAS